MTTLETVPFNKLTEHQIALVDLNTVPQRIAMDYQRRNQNLLEKNELCKRCDGTGNEMYNLYRECTDCFGSGIGQELDRDENYQFARVDFS